MLKRAFALILTICIILCVTNSIFVYASEISSGTCGTNLTWTLDNEGTLVISGTGEMNDYTYSSLAPWHIYRSHIKKIIINNGVTSIGNLAFHVLYEVVDVQISESVEKIGEDAFQLCKKLKKIEIPKKVECIERNTFYECHSLESVIFNGDISIIDYGAFHKCYKLSSITIPETVTYIGGTAFKDCIALENITIPNGVKSIEDYTFYECMSLKSIKIAETVESIGKYAFFDCILLDSIVIPQNVKTIKYGAFYNCCSISSINIPESVTLIEDKAFFSCLLKSITVDDNNLNYCDVNGILYNKDKTTLICYPSYRAEQSYDIIDTVTRIGKYAFYECIYLTEINIPEGVLIIDEGAFSASVIIKINIPQSVTTIEKDAFSFCNHITSVSISKNVSFIGEGAFSSCENIQCINVDDDNPYFCDINGILYTKDKTKIIQYVDSEVDNLISFEIPEYVTTIGASSFKNIYTLHSLKIPNSVKTIEDNAFYGIRGLKDIEIPDSVTSIGNSAFSFASIERIFLPNNITEIKSKTFKSCGALNSIVIPSSVKQIGDEAFYGCSSLIDIAIPKNVTSIGNEAFTYCEKLEKAYLPKGLLNIGTNIFYKSNELKTVYYTGSEEEWKEIDGSEYIDVTVVYDHKYTKTELQKDEKTFCISANNIEIGNEILLAIYNDNVFIKLYKKNFRGEDVNFVVEEEYDKAIIMTWEGLTNLQPLTKCEIILN